MSKKVNSLISFKLRNLNPSKTSLVIPQRNLTFERRNLYYKESFQKYKHYFEKPLILDNSSTYIDYIHNTFISPLFDSNLEIDRIKYIKKSIYKTDSFFNLRMFIFELYYDFFLNVELFFPYYDLYNIFAFLF